MSTDYRLVFYPGSFPMNVMRTPGSDHPLSAIEGTNFDPDLQPSTASEYDTMVNSLKDGSADLALMDDTVAVMAHRDYRSCGIIRIPTTYLEMPIAFGFRVSCGTLACRRYS